MYRQKRNNALHETNLLKYRDAISCHETKSYFAAKHTTHALKAREKCATRAKRGKKCATGAKRGEKCATRAKRGKKCATRAKRGKTCNPCKALESIQPAKSEEKHATDAKRGKKGVRQVLVLLEKCSVFFSDFSKRNRSNELIILLR